MADSRLVPNVSTTAVSLAVPAAVVDRADRLATETGLRRDELLELALRSRFDPPKSAAADLWAAYVSGRAQSMTEVAAALASEGVVRGVRGLRLGSPTTDRTPVPWKRDGIGAELFWDEQQTWPAVRGIWRMTTAGVTHIAGLRLGRVLGVYRVDGWAVEPLLGRKYATGGSFITADGRLKDAATGADRGPVTDTDRAVHSVLTRAPILAPPNQQPIIKLSAR